MNDDTQERLLEWAESAAQKGGAWLEQELPAFATEVAAWHFWSNLTMLAVFWALALILAVSGTLCIVLTRKMRWFDYASPGGRTVGLGVGMLLLIASALVFLGNAANYGYEMVKAKTAPRVVILEYVRGALK
jgi:hypothetical protein